MNEGWKQPSVLGRVCASDMAQTLQLHVQSGIDRAAMERAHNLDQGEHCSQHANELCGHGAGGEQRNSADVFAFVG